MPSQRIRGYDSDTWLPGPVYPASDVLTTTPLPQLQPAVAWGQVAGVTQLPLVHGGERGFAFAQWASPFVGLKRRHALQEGFHRDDVRRVAGGPLYHLRFGQLAPQFVENTVEKRHRTSSLYQEDGRREMWKPLAVCFVVED